MERFDCNVQWQHSEDHIVMANEVKNREENKMHIHLQNVLMQLSSYSPQRDLSKPAVTLPAVCMFMAVELSWSQKGMNDSGPFYACLWLFLTNTFVPTQSSGLERKTFYIDQWNLGKKT